MLPESLAPVLLTASPQQLSDKVCSLVLFQARKTNTGTISIGASPTYQPHTLEAGDSIMLDSTNLNNWYVSSNVISGDYLNMTVWYVNVVGSSFNPDTLGEYALSNVEMVRQHFDSITNGASLPTTYNEIAERINTVTAEAERIMDRHILSRRYKQWVRGQPAEYVGIEDEPEEYFFYVDEYPVTQIIEIYTGRMRTKSTKLVADTEYVIDEQSDGRIILNSPVVSPENIYVDYIAGSNWGDSELFEIEQIVSQRVIQLILGRRVDRNLSSESGNQYSISIMDPSTSGDWFQKALTRYRKIMY